MINVFKTKTMVTKPVKGENFRVGALIGRCAFVGLGIAVMTKRR